MQVVKAEIVENDQAQPDQEALKQLEKELQEFSGGLAYDRERIIERTQDGFRQGVEGFYRAGLGLILIYENEVAQTSAQILEQYFPGVSRRSAESYMRFARFASKLPNFKQFCLERGGYSKGLTMLQSCTEEQIDQFEESGVLLGYTPDQIDKMSVKTLKKALRRAREHEAQALKRAGGKLSEENAALKDQVLALVAQVGAGETPADAAIVLVKSAESKLLEGFRLLNKVPKEVMIDSPVLRDVMFGTFGMALRVLGNLESEVDLAIAAAAAREQGIEP